MLLKIMSGEDIPDSDSRKAFRLFDKVSCVTFNRAREDEAPRARIVFEDGDDESFPMTGNAYLMNQDGKTVAHFGAAPYHG